MKRLPTIALGLALATGAVLANQSVYDDLGVSQACRDDTAFWTLTDHTGPTVDAVDVTVPGLDSSLPAGDAYVATDSVFDALPIWFALSLGFDLDTLPSGTMLLFR